MQEIISLPGPPSLALNTSNFSAPSPEQAPQVYSDHAGLRFPTLDTVPLSLIGFAFAFCLDRGVNLETVLLIHQEPSR